jgi:hypothetical protein
MSQNKWIETDAVHEYLFAALKGVVCKEAWGEKSYFYNPALRFERGTYFATIKEKDGDNDRSSNLSRTGIWRLNIGVSKGAFVSMFGMPPARPGKGQVIEGPWDFQQTDMITPHPVYGWMSWVSVLNPSTQTWCRCQFLLEDAYKRAVFNFEKRVHAAVRKTGT